MLILTQMGGKLFRFLVIKAGFHFFPIQALSILTYLNSHGALAQLAISSYFPLDFLGF